MQNTNPTVEFSFYHLSLLAFLRESHPHLIDDYEFIQLRGDLAAQAYEDAMLDGSNQNQALEIANSILFEGLHFSLHNTIVNILWDEFFDEVPQDDAIVVAIMIYPLVEPIAQKYNTNDDDFENTPQFKALYTELVGAIIIHFEDYGV